MKTELKDFNVKMLNDQMPPKIIAKSFFKELKKLGFSDKQILQLAAELISNVSKNDRKEKKFVFYRVKGLTKLPY